MFCFFFIFFYFIEIKFKGKEKALKREFLRKRWKQLLKRGQSFLKNHFLLENHTKEICFTQTYQFMATLLMRKRKEQQ